MPNWCQNQITLTGPKAIIEEIAATKLSLEAIVPCPEELKRFQKITPVPRSEKKLRAGLKAKYGVETEFDWNVIKWGTKWDINLNSLDLDLNSELCFLYALFDSAWSPPVDAMRVLYDKYKDAGLELDLEYFEPGCRFLGTATGKRGKFEDEYREYQTADELDKHVQDLDHNLAEGEITWLREQEAEEGKSLTEPSSVKVSKPVPKAAPKKAAPKKAVSKQKDSKRNTP